MLILPLAMKPCSFFKNSLFTHQNCFGIPPVRQPLHFTPPIRIPSARQRLRCPAIASSPLFCSLLSSPPLLESVAKTAISFAAALLLAVSPANAKSEEVFGLARIVDGDSLVVDGTRIRLLGIDAPETQQSCEAAKGAPYACGEASKAALERKIGGAPVRCDIKRKDMYGRSVAICKQGGTDLNGWMVAEGHAVAYRRYSTAYVELERAAQEGRRGIWSGAFEQPDQWRKEHPRNGKSAAASGVAAPLAVALPVPSTAPQNDGCLIKGNISAKGERVYHVPGGRSYEATKIDRAGEKWFCSEGEAAAAGWRPAKA